VALWGDGWQGPSHTAASVTRQRLSQLTCGPGVDLWALSRWGSQRALTGISIEAPPEASRPLRLQPPSRSRLEGVSKEAVDVLEGRSLEGSCRRLTPGTSSSSDAVRGQIKRYRGPGPACALIHHPRARAHSPSPSHSPPSDPRVGRASCVSSQGRERRPQRPAHGPAHGPCRRLRNRVTIASTISQTGRRMGGRGGRELNHGYHQNRTAGAWDAASHVRSNGARGGTRDDLATSHRRLTH
jgi:hypothetical protein